MRFLAILFSLFISSRLCLCQTNEICITIDDLPFVSYGINDTTFLRNATNRLVSSLRQNNIPAIGFVSGKKLFVNEKPNSFQIGLLNLWLENGLELGNHSYSHFDYNNISFDEYSKDIIKGENPLKEILRQKNKELKYFRHPMLHVGNTKDKADSLSVFISKKGYIVAPVTIDNDDYLFALAYKRTLDKKDTSLAKQIGKDYVLYMEKKIKYFQKQSIALFNENIKQILLIHASQLNSDYIDSLILMIKKNDYNFIDLTSTLKDEAYRTQITTFGKWGISWIDRWALSAGKKSDFFKDDPPTPEYIIELSKIEK
jgi:peptidoglycan/xylan/chitin deacetylase (PgdA/CDA1 family)